MSDGGLQDANDEQPYRGARRETGGRGIVILVKYTRTQRAPQRRMKVKPAAVTNQGPASGASYAQYPPVYGAIPTCSPVLVTEPYQIRYASQTVHPRTYGEHVACPAHKARQSGTEP